MKTPAAVYSLVLFFALPVAAQRGGSSSGSHSSGGSSSGSHASGGSSSHGSGAGSFHGSGSSGVSHGPSGGSSGVGNSRHSSYSASSSGYSAATASHFYRAAGPASVAQAAGRYTGSTPFSRSAAVVQRGVFVRAPYVGSLSARVATLRAQAGRPPFRPDTPSVITRRRGPFITSVPVDQFENRFSFGFGNGFHHGFGRSFCGSSFEFGFGGFNSFDCFGSSFADPFFYSSGFDYGYGQYYGAPYPGYAVGAQPADQYDVYEPPSAPGTYTPGALTPAEPEQPAARKTVTLLQLKDGSMYGVTDYWLDHGQLHYVASYGGENAVPLERIDLDKTVEINSAKGIGFVLRNAPSTPPLLPLQPTS